MHSEGNVVMMDSKEENKKELWKEDAQEVTHLSNPCLNPNHPPATSQPSEHTEQHKNRLICAPYWDDTETSGEVT